MTTYGILCIWVSGFNAAGAAYYFQYGTAYQMWSTLVVAIACLIVGLLYNNKRRP